MWDRFAQSRVAQCLATSWTIWLMASGAVSAQEKSDPPVVIDTTPAVVSDLPNAPERALISPNMYGQVLGTRWFNVAGPGFGGGGVTRTLSGFVRDAVPSNASFTANAVIPSPTLTPLSVAPLNFQGVTIPFVPFTATAPINNVAFPATVAIIENASVTAAIQKGFAQPGETAVFNATSNAQLVLLNIYDIFLVYDFVSGRGVIVAPNPADGGLAGRNRVSTDSNPLPRDRVIFNYDFVSNSALMPSTPTMNRFLVGFEKTFFDGIASVEFRVPFAATVNSTSNVDGTFGSGRGELGNLFLVPKVLLYASEVAVLSAGLGVSLPTADDVRLHFGGADVLKIRNEAVILTPYLAGLWTPSDRVFAQSWLAFGLDTNGNAALTNLDGTGLRTAGRLYDPSTIQVDAQLGYWFLHPAEATGLVRGLAPFVEFHFNHQLQAQNSVADGAFTLMPSVGQLTEFNLSTGLAAQFGENANVMLGATFPMTNEQNRFSDWQLGLRVNYFFGPTGRARANLFN